tara:strand:- start:68 stop:286 length:219 start_codon:yes stop_codon:yes gene_type:complete
MVKESTKPACLFFVRDIATPSKFNMGFRQFVGRNLIVLFNIFGACHTTDVEVMLFLVHEYNSVTFEVQVPIG